MSNEEIIKGYLELKAIALERAKPLLELDIKRCNYDYKIRFSIDDVKLYPDYTVVCCTEITRHDDKESLIFEFPTNLLELEELEFSKHVNNLILEEDNKKLKALELEKLKKQEEVIKKKKAKEARELSLLKSLKKKYEQ